MYVSLQSITLAAILWLPMILQYPCHGLLCPAHPGKYIPPHHSFTKVEPAMEQSRLVGVTVGRLAPGLVSARASVPGDLVADLAPVAFLLSFWLYHRIRCVFNCDDAVVGAAF